MILRDLEKMYDTYRAPSFFSGSKVFLSSSKYRGPYLCGYLFVVALFVSMIPLSLMGYPGISAIVLYLGGLIACLLSVFFNYRKVIKLKFGWSGPPDELYLHKVKELNLSRKNLEVLSARALELYKIENSGRPWAPVWSIAFGFISAGVYFYLNKLEFVLAQLILRAVLLLSIGAISIAVTWRAFKIDHYTKWRAVSNLLLSLIVLKENDEFP